MQLFKTLTLALSLLLWGQLNAQTRIEANSKYWTAYQSEATFDGDIIHLEVTREPGILWLNNINFKNGIVELDIKKGLRGLLGIAFHGLDNNHYDAVYFRPPNFRRPEKRDNAIQYISMPDNPWFKLRKESPGKYESSVQPAPNPDDWFHAKIVIESHEVKVYVNKAGKPSLVVEKISKKEGGKLGLWVDVNDNDGWFKNVTITKSN